MCAARSPQQPVSILDGVNRLSLDPAGPSLASQLQGPKSSMLHKELERLPQLSARFEDGEEVDDGARSAPVGVRDPQAQLLTVSFDPSSLHCLGSIDIRVLRSQFIQHLLSNEHADSDPHLVAIGYELEALLSIYPASLKLSVTSRPSSLYASSPPRDLNIQTSPTKRASQSWNDAVFDASIWTPGERIRYEINIPVWEQGEVLEGIKEEDMPSEIPTMRVLVSLPPTYPSSAPPQLQLLGRYMGSFGIDAGLCESAFCNIRFPSCHEYQLKK